MECARIVEKVMQFQAGEHAEVVEWLRSLGCLVVRAEDCTWTIQGIAGVRSALVGGTDPVTTAVCMGFLLAGGYWTQVYPSLLHDTNRAWTAAMKARRERV